MPFPVMFTTPGEEFSTYATNTRGWPLGTRLVLQDGRGFRFGENSATVLVVARLCQAAVPTASQLNQTVNVAGVINDRTIDMVNGAVDITADLYYEGVAYVNEGAGAGYLYLIDTHAAFTDLTAQMPLAPGYALQVATTTASNVSLIRNLYKAIIVHPSPPTQALVGVAMKPHAASAFGWFQTQGYGPILTDGTIVNGDVVVPSDTVDGAVEALPGTYTAANHELPHPFIVQDARADTEISLVKMMLE